MNPKAIIIPSCDASSKLSGERERPSLKLHIYKLLYCLKPGPEAR
jgi:hypothetical protein